MPSMWVVYVNPTLMVTLSGFCVASTSRAISVVCLLIGVETQTVGSGNVCWG